MRKRIVTHPDNLKYVEELVRSTEEKDQVKNSGWLHYINPFATQITTNPNMERERWTGKYEVLQDRFSTYWDGKGEPPSWCLYFGFVRKIMEPNFIEIDDRSMVLRMDWGPVFKDNRKFLLTASC